MYAFLCHLDNLSVSRSFFLYVFIDLGLCISLFMYYVSSYVVRYFVRCYFVSYVCFLRLFSDSVFSLFRD